MAGVKNYVVNTALVGRHFELLLFLLEKGKKQLFKVPILNV